MHLNCCSSIFQSCRKKKEGKFFKFELFYFTFGALIHSLFRLLRRPITKAGFDSSKEKVWFAKNVVGLNKLTQTYRELGVILENDEFKNITGHGGRACFITENLLHGVTTKAVMGQTGHANEQSMQPYIRPTAEAEQILQDVIGGKHRRIASPVETKGKKKNSPKKMSSKKKESKNRKEGQGHSNPGSPSKLGFRDAKKGKIESAGARIPCTISIDDSDDEKVGVKVEHVEESVDGKMKDKVVEELKEQLIEQKKESAEIKQKLDRVLERSGVGGVLDMNAVHSGMPTHQQHLMQVPYGPMGTMNAYGGSHFVYPPHQYPTHQAMPPLYPPAPTQHDWSGFGGNGSRLGNHNEDDDEKAGGYSLNFSCVVS